MSQDRTVYDLGAVGFDDDLPYRAKERAAGPKRGGTVSDAGTAAGAAGVSGSLSLFLPGCGQIVAGEVAAGLFFLSSVGLCGALLWAISSSIERIVPTLSLLGIGRAPVAITAMVAFFAAAVLHVSAVLHADGLDGVAWSRRAPHPLTAGLASLLVPGWGQLLSGHRRRMALFLVALWTAAAGWAVVSPSASHVLSVLRIELPVWMRDGAGPAALIGLPALTWIVAIYDAVAGAVMERHRSR